MEKEDFLYREVVFREDLETEVNTTETLIVSRIRTTKNSVGIKISFGNQSITFNKPGYEWHAKRAAQFLETAADHPCLLPEVES